MAAQSSGQKRIVSRVMDEFKHGRLKMAQGPKVTSPKQAIAIALHEAGASNRETPADNRANLRRTRARDASTTPTRAALYAEARRRNVKGRSGMSKAELQAALR